MEEGIEDGRVLSAYKGRRQGSAVYGRASCLRFLLSLRFLYLPLNKQMSTAAVVQPNAPAAKPMVATPMKGGVVLSPAEFGASGGRRKGKKLTKKMKKMMRTLSKMSGRKLKLMGGAAEEAAEVAEAAPEGEETAAGRRRRHTRRHSRKSRRHSRRGMFF